MALTKISTDGVKDDAVTAGKIPANAVGSSELADNAVDTAAIVNANVTEPKLATDSVSTSKIINTAVTTAKIANNAVTADKLPNAGVTLAKIQDVAQDRIIGRISSGSGTMQELSAANVRTILNVADGATNSTSTTINGNTNNQIITATGTANTLNGEANLIFDGSNLGIRTTPSQPLHINQAGSSTTMRIENANADFLIQAGSAGAGGLHLYDMDNNAYRAVLTNTGNLGINTISPSHKLHVESATSGVIAAKQTTNNGGFNTFEGKSSGGSVTFYASHNGRVGATEGVIFGSDTAAANVLGDYEEGTFSFSFPGGISITNNEMAYTKIGRFVMCSGRLTFASSGSNTIINMVGLPFTPNANLGNSAMGGVVPEHTRGSNGPLFMAVESSTNKVRIRNGASQNQTIANMSGQSIRFQLTYMAA